MKTVTIKELGENTKELIKNVVDNDEFFEVETEHGMAVVISEREWNVFVQSLGMRKRG